MWMLHITEMTLILKWTIEIFPGCFKDSGVFHELKGDGDIVEKVKQKGMPDWRKKLNELGCKCSVVCCDQLSLIVALVTYRVQWHIDHRDCLACCTGWTCTPLNNENHLKVLSSLGLWVTRLDLWRCRCCERLGCGPGKT